MKQIKLSKVCKLLRMTEIERRRVEIRFYYCKIVFVYGVLMAVCLRKEQFYKLQDSVITDAVYFKHVR